MRVRRTTRGAVLVEAILVVAALVSFLVAFLFVHGAFTRQLQAQEVSRAAAFAFAMNGCEGDIPSGLAPEDAALIGAPATGAGSADTVADAQTASIGEPAAVSAFSKAVTDNEGFGMPDTASIAARGEASATDGRETLGGTMHARTTLLCNEKPRAGRLSDSISTIVDFLEF